MSIKEKKIHPWRICPIGKHFVRTHKVNLPPSKNFPDGRLIVRHEHCAKNSSSKDILFFDEIQLITDKFFKALSGALKTGVLKGYSNADKFDSEIRGWTKYWNEVLSFPIDLSPNVVKALIASESSFYPETDIPSGQGNGRARGLMQVTDFTMNILADHKGELHDHLICFEHKKLLDPSANICAGIRWLFRCMVIAKSKLGNSATWVDAVIQYKGKIGIVPHPKEVEIFLHHYSCFL